MPSYLRLTPEDYYTLRTACAGLQPTDRLDAFQAALAEAVRPRNGALAERVARLCEKQVGLLLDHLLRDGTRPVARSEEPGKREEEDGLTVQEWKVVWRACQLLWVRGDWARPFHEQLFGEVSEAEPDLAAKLAGFNEGQLSTLLRRVLGGRRW